MEQHSHSAPLGIGCMFFRQEVLEQRGHVMLSRVGQSTEHCRRFCQSRAQISVFQSRFDVELAALDLEKPRQDPK